MKQKIFLLALALIMLLTVKSALDTPVSATSGTTGECTWSLNGTVLTISGNGAMADYILGNSAPWWSTPITEIIFGDGVTYIGEYAFYMCNGLTSVTIPNNVKAIGNYAFAECYNLSAISIPDSITAVGTYSFSLTPWFDAQPDGPLYAGKAFYGVKGTCPSNLVLKEGTVSIAPYALSSQSLASIMIPSSVTSIGQPIFGSCNALESITVDSVNPVYHSQENCIIETASKTLIAGCKSSVIPADGSVTTIGEYAFYSCTGLTAIDIPDSVRSIGGSAFCFCYDLEKVTIPDSVISIEDSAFHYCSALTSVDFPNSVVSIGESAFFACRSLTRLTIPNSVTFIGKSAFSACAGLTAVRLGSGITTIEYQTFYQCGNLAYLVFTDRLTSIGKYAFQYTSPQVWYIGKPEALDKISIEYGNPAPLSDYQSWHILDSECDPNCNDCGKINIHPADHTYSNVCDATCDLCGAERVTLGHLYEDECYPDCKFCGERRTVRHQYTSDCDERCDLCQRRRAVSHTFTDDADPNCNECDGKRPSFLVGDLDRNGSLELDDAIYALYHVNFPDTYPAGQSVDFDGNEKNDLNDAIHLLYHVNFPDQYPLNKGFFLRWPLSEEHTGTVTSSNALNNPFIDIDVGGWANNGKIPALAAEDGVVVRQGYYSDWGNLVVVDHGDGYLTYYAHLDSAGVSFGDRVSSGDELGKIGATGNTTTVKLHFLLYAPVGSNNTSVRTDPLKYIKAPQ